MICAPILVGLLIVWYYTTTFSRYYLFKTILRDSTFKYFGNQLSNDIWYTENKKYFISTGDGIVCLKSEVTGQCYFLETNFPFWVFYPRFHRLLRAKLQTSVS